MQIKSCSRKQGLLWNKLWFLDVQAKNLFKDYQPGVMKNGGKLVVLMEIIEESLKQGEKILIFRWEYERYLT